MLIPVIFSIFILAVFCLFSFLFNELIILYLGLPFSFAVFFFSHALIDDENKAILIKINAKLPILISCTITIFAVFAILFIPVYNGSLFNWTNVPFLNWARYGASVLLTLFLPGYFLIKLLDRKNTLKLYSIIPLSYILSMLITYLIGFILLLVYNSISSFALVFSIAFNLILMTVYLLRCYKTNYSESVEHTSIPEIGLLLATLSVVLVGSIFVMNSTLPLMRGDMWDHLAGALQYSKGFPVHSGLLIPDYPYLFYVYLATFFQLSGLSASISYQALFALSFVSILSFYSFVKEWFPKKNIASISVLLVSLLGFGSLYILYLKSQNANLSLSAALSTGIPKTYDINDIMVIGPVLSNVVPILLIALPTLFMFLFLLKSNLKNITKSFLFAILVSVSFLGHPDVPFFMALSLLLYAFIHKGESVRAVVIGSILGLLLVALLDFSAPARIYLWGLNAFSFGTMTYFVTLSIFILSYVYSLVSKHIHLNLNIISNSSKKYGFSIISWGVICLYFFSIMTWLNMLSRYNAYTFGSYNFTPFFVWAIRFGAIGLFSILCVSLYLGNVLKDKRLMFCTAIAASGFILEQLANYFPVYQSYRFATLTLIGAVPLAAYFIVKHFSTLSGNRKILFATVLLLIIVSGMVSSSFGYYAEGKLKPNINNYEIEALTFIGQNLKSNSTVLTLTDDSASKLQTFAGVNQIQILQTWDYLVLNNTDPSSFLYFLGTSNVKYIYLSEVDAKELNSSPNVLSNLIDYFPLDFQNNYVSIFNVPPATQPSRQSNFTVLNPLTVDATDFEQSYSKDSLLLQCAPSFLQLNYTFLSTPLEENMTSIKIKDFENLQWKTAEGSGQMILDKADRFDGTQAVTISNLTSDENGYFAITHLCSSRLFNNFSSLQLPIKVSNDVCGSIKVILRDSKGCWNAWLTQDFKKSEWLTLTLPLSKPSLESALPFNLSDVIQFEVGFQNLGINESYSFLKIGEVNGLISASFIPYEAINNGNLNHSSTIMLASDPRFDANSLLQYASDGIQIIVFGSDNSNAGFFFNYLELASRDYCTVNEIYLSTPIKLPRIEVAQVSSNSNVSCTAYYGLDGNAITPFIFAKKIGLGSVNYIILPSSVDSIDKPITKFIDLIGDVLNQTCTTSKAEYTVNSLGSYNTLEGTINMSGTLEVETERLLTTQPASASDVTLRAAKSSLINLSNISLNRLNVYGSSKLIVNNTALKIAANSVSSYLTVSSPNLVQSFYIELSENAVATLSITNSSGTYSFSIRGGSLLLCVTPLNLLVCNPSLRILGNVLFESARVEYSNPYVPIAGVVRNNLSISGKISFTAPFSIDNLILLTNFSYDGVASNSKQSPAQYAKLDIQWVGLLLSPTSLALYLLVFVFIVVITRKRNFGV